MLGGRTYRMPAGLVKAAAVVVAVAQTAPADGAAADAPWPSGSAIAVPSGQDITFMDVIYDVQSGVGEAFRYRFLAPGIARDAGSIAFVQAEEDMAALCQDFILPKLIETGAEMPAQIIVVLSDRPVEFGIADPDATQFFEAYRPEDVSCIWEGF